MRLISTIVLLLGLCGMARAGGSQLDAFREMYRSSLKRYGIVGSKAPYHLLNHRAAGYYRAGSETKAAPFNFDSGITVSNGGLNAPIPDMLKYLNFLFGDPRH